MGLKTLCLWVSVANKKGKTMFNEMNVISTYTRKDAIEDGILEDISEIAQETGFTCPVAISQGVTYTVHKALINPKYQNDREGILWDILTMAKSAIKNYEGDSNILSFKVIITGAGPRKYHDLKLICGPGDQGEMVITILLPQED